MHSDCCSLNIMKRKLTLLAPAHDVEVAKAAIQAGADAVYIGAPRFGARQAAGNSVESIRQLVDYARPYGVQIIVTLNTLLTDQERKEAVTLAWQLYEAGVSALIIQDMNLLLEDLPPLRLHASTQCDNRTPEQVKHLEELGFKRVVLARELGLKEIRAIREKTSVELEAFVHGALCVSYSGRCYLSEVLMNRSANRGCCAQMCRQRYDLLDANMQEVRDDNGKPIHQRYLLSLQDMDRSLYLKDLIEAGVTTFKIEGRLKDKEYVTNIVAYYRQKLDNLMPSLDAESASEASVYNYGFVPNPEKTFHRGGITYFLHEREQSMTSWESPKSTGEFIGTVRKVGHNELHLNLQPDVKLHNGDGLCFEDKGFSVNKAEGDIIVPNRMPDLRAGARIFRNKDTEFERSIWAERRIPLLLGIQETETGFLLWAETTGRRSEYAVDAPHEPAKNEERALQTLREQLSKLGDTPYIAQNVEIKTPPYFIPISQINQWRRDLIMRL